jgi:signal transduction histidine kinase
MRSWLNERPWTADSLLAIVLCAVGLITVHRVPPLDGAADAVVVRDLLVLALFLPLAWRRRAPRVVLCIVAVASAATWIGYFVDGTTAVAGGIAVYGVGRYVERPASLRMAALTAMFAGSVAAVISLVGPDSWYVFFSRCGVIGACFALGDSQRSRTALVANLQAQAERADSLRVLEAERAVAEERARIAREMHDVVAHSLSVMVVQAVAAERLFVSDPTGSVASISSVAEVGRRALGDMRRIFDIFVDPDRSDPFSPQPSITDLEAIVDTYRSAGMTVDFDCHGQIPALDSVTELSIVRIVQESLTNVLKHSNGADAAVTLHFDPERISVEVADNGRGHASGASTDGSGRGLIGIRERVDALGGTVTARRFAGRGFLVRAILPVERTRTSRVPARVEEES